VPAPRFIAEIGSNHNRDLSRCLALVDGAAEAGCDAVKLQVFTIDELFAPEALTAHPQLGERRAWEFPLEFLPDVRRRCDERGLELGAAAFSLAAVEALAGTVDFLKVASYELLWHDLVQACAATGRPLILSTGMATGEEVASAVAAARRAGAEDLRLLHCVSGYPTPPGQTNLAAIATLRDSLDCAVGWSDHTDDPRIVLRAVARWGASDIELHIDLDGSGFEAGEHCWTPAAVGELIRDVRAGREDGLDDATARLVDGDGVKRPMPAEEPDVAWRADPVDGLRPLRSTRRALVPA
jgi:N-acetylneuraminate synthase